MRRPVELPAPPAVAWIVRHLEGAGHSTWAVGGAVRDTLAGDRPGDWDLATAAHPRQVRRLFRRTVPIGVEHGTVGVLARDGTMYEVTTFRRDVETDGRHASVVFAETIEEDLARRDFTMNAIAWHPLRGEVRDPHGGLGDLRSGLLRTVGEAADRFREDRLRILRCLRFAGRFDLQISEETWAALRSQVGALHELSAERVREELMKTLAMPAGTAAALRLYRSSGALAVLYPELGPTAEGWERTIQAVEAMPPHRTRLRLAVLLHAAGAARARNILLRLKASNAEIDRVTHLVTHHATLPSAGAAPAAIRGWLSTVGPDYVPDLCRIDFALARVRGDEPAQWVHRWREVRHVIVERPPLKIADLAIDGADLRAEGLRPGPRFGSILRDLLARVIEDPSLNERERLLEIVRSEDGGR